MRHELELNHDTLGLYETAINFVIFFAWAASPLDLVQAFDKDKDAKIDWEEFVTGVAAVRFRYRSGGDFV